MVIGKPNTKKFLTWDVLNTKILGIDEQYHFKFEIVWTRMLIFFLKLFLSTLFDFFSSFFSLVRLSLSSLSLNLSLLSLLFCEFSHFSHLSPLLGALFSFSCLSLLFSSLNVAWWRLAWVWTWQGRVGVGFAGFGVLVDGFWWWWWWWWYFVGLSLWGGGGVC